MIKLYGKQKAEFERLVRESSCQLNLARRGDELHSCLISFSGELQMFPSTSNMKRTYVKKVHTKKGKDVQIGGLRTDPDAQIRLEAFKHLYFEALRSKGLSTLTFGKTPVHISLALPKRSRAYDSHNYPKPVCDWLQAVGLIENDSRAQCWPLKREDYGPGDLASTKILIVTFRAVSTLCKDFIGNVFRTAGFSNRPESPRCRSLDGVPGESPHASDPYKGDLGLLPS